MRFGIALPNFRPFGTRDVLVEIAQEAEALGYDSMWSTDVVVQTRSAEDERFAHCLEAMTVTTYLAALTTRIRLGLSVLVLPQRSPVVVAKELATLDCLSGGRVVLGVGAGSCAGARASFLRPWPKLVGSTFSSLACRALGRSARQAAA